MGGSHKIVSSHGHSLTGVNSVPSTEYSVPNRRRSPSCACFLTVIAASLSGTLASAGDYPKPQLLMEPRVLAGGIKNLVILDVRPKEKYLGGHVPQAINVNADDWRSAFGDGSDEKGWANRIGALGIDNSKPVVVYDDAAGKDAARVWWILRYWGVKDARLLNGFWHGWKAAMLPTQILEPVARPVAFKANRQSQMSADKDRVKAASDTGGDQVQIVDARSLAEHVGDEAMKNKRAGHIPNACHLDWSDLVDTKGTQRFRTAPELRERFAKAKIDLGKPIIAHCQSGGRASVMVFAISLMGGDNVANYHPSFGEWSADDKLPVKKGKSP